MSLELTLTFGDPPAEAEFPGTPKALGDFLVRYLAVAGGETFIPVNFGADEPGVDDRDKPWFKTDEDGVPIGWYSWNGIAWEKTPEKATSGTTAERPVADTGTLFFDTDINALLVFERGQWRTAAGSPGDVKFVKAATIDDAIEANPGWIQDPDSMGRVIGAAGAGLDLTERAFADAVGAETHTLVATETPEHDHSLPWAAFGGQHQNGTQAAGIYPVVTGAGSTNTSTKPASGTGNLAHNNMQPTVFYWALVKE